MNKPTSFTLLSTIFIAFTGICSARSTYPGLWSNSYPASQTAAGITCALCHNDNNGGDGWNFYGWELRKQVLTNENNIVAAFQSVESIDSDGNGDTNLAEINGDTQPGWTEGANNTFFFKNGSTTTGNSPIGIITNADPEQSPFVAWITGFGLTGPELEEDADPDKDQHTNIQEFAFGGLPNDASSFPNPSVTPNSGNNPSFTIDVRTNDPSLTITPTWSATLISPFSSNDFTTTSDAASSFGADYVRRTFNTSLTGQSVLFFRAEAQITTP